MPLQKRVDQLPAVTGVTGPDLLILSRVTGPTAGTRRVSVDQIGTYFQMAGVAGPTGATGPAGQLASHAATHAAAGPDPVTIVASQVSDFTSAVISAAPPTTNASLLTSGTLPDARLSANIARTSDVSSAVAGLVNSAPAALDTLKELADALGNDASFSATITNALAAKAPLASPTFTGTVSGIGAAFQYVSITSFNYPPGPEDKLLEFSDGVDTVAVITATGRAIFSGGVSASSLPLATTSARGAIVVGAGLAVSNGTVSANVTSVAGRTGAVTIAAADVSGLGSLATVSPTGTANNTTFLRGDGQWAVVNTGGAVLSDTVSNVNYLGLAASGSATSASVWTIRRTTVAAAGTVTSATATNVRWDDRTSATYS